MPTQLGDYLLGDRIAAGGMAEIYRAEIHGLGGFKREVAIKKILPEYCNDEQFVTMLLDEARIAARLQHPNIAQVIQCGCVEGAYFIVMELVDGIALSRVLSSLAKKEQRLSPSTAVHAGVGLLRGLDFAHKAKADDGSALRIVHRDVSPHNLLVSVHGDVKLVDFGVASAADRLHKTESGVLKGKLSYMAPEQVEGKGVDARSDQYAAALVVAESLTGRRVYAGHSEIDVIKAVLDGRTENIEENMRTAEVPAAAASAVLKALSRSPSDRFADCEAFAQALLQAVPVDVEAARGELSSIVARARTEQAAKPAVLDEDHDTEAPTKRLTPAKPSAMTPSPATATVKLPSRATPAPSRRSFGALAGVAAAFALVAVAVAAIVVAVTRASDVQGSNGGAVTTTNGVPGSNGGVATRTNGVPGSNDGAVSTNGVPGSNGGAATRTNGVPGSNDGAVSTNGVPGSNDGAVSTNGVQGSNGGAATPTNGVPGSNGGAVSTTNGVPGAGRGAGSTTNGVPGSNAGAVSTTNGAPGSNGGAVSTTNGVTDSSGAASTTGVKATSAAARAGSSTKTGTLDLACLPWCEITIDGKSTGLRSPLQGHSLSAGKHVVDVVNPPSGKRDHRVVEIHAGEPTKVGFRLE